MSQLTLAANYIENTEFAADYGHLQLVKGASGEARQEIEVQSGFPHLTFRDPKLVYENTSNYGDPQRWSEIAVGIDDRAVDDVWEVLKQINEWFVSKSPNYLYTLGQNSNSYINTLLWMVGVDLGGYLEAVRPPDVAAFPGADRNLLTDGYGATGSLTFDIVDLSGTSGDDIIRTGDGDDTLIGDAGNDRLSGGEGVDAIDYSRNQGVSGAEGIRADVTVPAARGGATIAVIDPWGNTDVLAGFERMVSTDADDVVSLHGAADDIFYGDFESIDGRGQGSVGDTLNLGGVSGSQGLEVVAQNGVMVVSDPGGSVSSVSLVAAGFENVIGSAGDDTITGDGESNRLEGGGGVDTLEGGAGNDTLVFDADDTVDGGAGFDTGYADKDVGMQLDAAALDLEVIVSGAGVDTFTADGSEAVMLAGSGGDDTFNINRSSSSPTVVWGGDGADKIVLEEDEGPAGILVVQVDGLTEENFHLFDLEELGLGNGFDWTQIDVVVINPDASDRVLMEEYGLANPHLLEVRREQVEIVRLGSGEEGALEEKYGEFPQDRFQFAGGGSTKVEHQAQSFLKGYGGTVYAPWDDSYTMIVLEFRDGGGDPFIVVGSDGWDEHDPFGINPQLDDEWHPEISRTYDLSRARFVSSWRTDFYQYNPLDTGHTGTRLHYFYAEDARPLEVLQVSWFIAGGELSGSSLFSTGSISVTMPDPEQPGAPGINNSADASSTSANNAENLDSGSVSGQGGNEFWIVTSSGDGPRPPRGGAYLKASGGSNVESGDGVLRVGGFDAATDTVVVNGHALSGSDLPNGVTAWDYRGSAVIQYGRGEAVVLRGVTVDQWQAGAAGQILGTAAAENLEGTASADVIAGGGGADTITAGAGDDRINFASGDDVILGDLLNAGADTLDLRRFKAGKVTLRVSEEDVLIATPDGTIRLGSQVLHDLGHARSNIERILFADGTLDEGAIRSRAIADQATSSDDTVEGTAFVDYLRGASGNDVLLAKDGADTLDGGTGADRMSGGKGDDTYYVDTAADLVIEAADEGTDTVNSRVSYALADEVEHLTLIGWGAIGGTGNALANILTGNAGANTLSGLGGNDRLAAADGDDTLLGGDGDDTLDGGAGADSMAGGDGDDIYAVDDGLDIVAELEGHGIDLVQASVSYVLSAEVENLTLIGRYGWEALNGTGNALANVLTGSAGPNSMGGLDGDDTLIGGGGFDTLDGGAGADSMSGGSGNDTYVVDMASDLAIEAAGEGIDQVNSSASFTLAAEVENLTLIGAAAIDGTGNVLANTLTGNAAANRLSGMAGNDRLLAGDGDDTLLGGDGSDTLDGGAGSDSMAGGLGNDLYVVDDATDTVTEVSAGGTDTVESLITYALGSAVENLTLKGSAAIDGTGNAAANVLTGNSGANALYGLDGNDTLVGGDGADTLDGGVGADGMRGGRGDDSYVVDATSDLITEWSGEGIDSVQSSVSYTLASGVENLTLTGTGAINGTGNTLANVLTGNAGGNSLSGGDGNDTLFGEDGNDTLNGGNGNDAHAGGNGNDLIYGNVGLDSFDGGADVDTLDFTYYTAAVRIDLGAGLVTFLSDSSTEQAMNFENVVAGAGSDTLIGTAASNSLTGSAGNDTLDGGAGADTLAGGAGNDTYRVDAGTDLVIEGSGAGTDLVQSSVAWTLGANTESLTLTGSEAIDGTGNSLANALVGNGATNALSGLGGNDRLTGGGGADRFVFAASGNDADTIADFNELDGGGEEGDVLQFSGLVGTFAYRGGSVFTGGSDNSEARVSGSNLLMDMNGDGITDITIAMTGLASATQLAASDFAFV